MSRLRYDMTLELLDERAPAPPQRILDDMALYMGAMMTASGIAAVVTIKPAAPSLALCAPEPREEDE